MKLTKPSILELRSLSLVFDGQLEERVRNIALLATCSAVVVLAACGKTQPERSAPVLSNTSVAWPPLPTTGFVSGRPATKRDVSDGNAVFVAEREGASIGEPLTIDIPQYAVHIDAASGVRTRVIVVQAERAGGIEMIGYRTLEDQDGVGTLPEFELLGRTPRAQ